MRLIDELFKGYILNYEALIKYGFKLIDNKYLLDKEIYNNSFILKLSIIDGKIDGILVDKDFNEEYKQINSTILSGFALTLKEECEEALIDVRDNCFTKDTFIYSQTNRINKLIKEKYNVTPEFLWDKTPNAGVYRNKRSNKWFSIVMAIPKNRIIGSDETIIEVMNLNLGLEASDYLKNDYIYPAYHMNKKYWVSIILDGSLSDDFILELINKSFNISDLKGHWLIPANPAYYDVVNMFNNSVMANWKQYNNILVGDIIYLYVGSPYKEIMFKCEVVETNIPYEFKNDNLTINNLIKIKLLKKYKSQEFSFKRLNELGIKAIRGPRLIPNNLIQLL